MSGQGAYGDYMRQYCKPSMVHRSYSIFIAIITTVIGAIASLDFISMFH